MIRLLILSFLTLLLPYILLNSYYQSKSTAANSAEDIAYPEHLTGTFTGGFGEETCRSCHFDYDLNPGGGGVAISGIRENISAGESVEIEIVVEREGLGAAGFQLSARYENGSQAGKFNIEGNDRIMFSEAVPDSLEYVQHSNKGTNPSAENTSSWNVEWEAPESPDGSVIFNVAVNAANGDQSEFEDFIYFEELEIKF